VVTPVLVLAPVLLPQPANASAVTSTTARRFTS